MSSRCGGQSDLGTVICCHDNHCNRPGGGRELRAVTDGEGGGGERKEGRGRRGGRRGGGGEREGEGRLGRSRVPTHQTIGVSSSVRNPCGVI